MSLPTDPLLGAIETCAELATVPLWNSGPYTFRPDEVLEALVLTESSGRIKARRYEKHQDRAGRRDQAFDKDVPDQDDGEREDDASYGLTQVMGYNLTKYWPELWGGRRRVPDEAMAEAFKIAGGPAADSPIPPRSFAWALVPAVNLDAGCWMLRAELRTVALEEKDADGRLYVMPDGALRLGEPGDPEVEVPAIERALARYNGGPSGDDLVDGDMRLRAYVERVRAHAVAIRQERGA